MATDRQIAANRANAQKSTGPKTEAGKRSSSQNATTHGVLSQLVVLKTEREPAFAELLETLENELAPTTALERICVENMAVARWRQLRIWIIQTATLDVATVDQPLEVGNEPVRVALAFQSLADASRVLPLLQRYEVANDRMYHRSLNMLRKLRAEKAAQAASAEQAQPATPNLPNEPNLPSNPATAEARTTHLLPPKPKRPRPAAPSSAFRHTRFARPRQRRAL